MSLFKDSTLSLTFDKLTWMEISFDRHTVLNALNFSYPDFQSAIFSYNTDTYVHLNSFSKDSITATCDLSVGIVLITLGWTSHNESHTPENVIIGTSPWLKKLLMYPVCFLFNGPKTPTTFDRCFIFEQSEVEL